MRVKPDGIRVIADRFVIFAFELPDQASLIIGRRNRGFGAYLMAVGINSLVEKNDLTRLDPAADASREEPDLVALELLHGEDAEDPGRIRLFVFDADRCAVFRDDLLADPGIR